MKEKRKSIEEIDKNFAVEKVTYEGMTTYHLPCTPFAIDGLYCAEPGDYCRLPHEVARQCNESLQEMYVCPSGGRIRFRTDSERIVIKCTMPDMTPFPHMPFTGSHCFDLYADGTYVNTFRPDTSGAGEHVRRVVYFAAHGYDALMSLPGRRMREILIHFPLYSRVDDVWIALEEGATVEAPAPYAHRKPFVFYGTSVTQGGCVSHPGNSYPALLSQWLDADFVNLGFSDGGRGEQTMAEYLSSLSMSALVLNYDQNVSAEDIKKTYEPFYKTIRATQPELPIIFAGTMLSYYQKTETAQRWEVIRGTYERAVAEGDTRVWCIDGREVIAPYGGTDTCSVEGNHANDLGSWVYAKAFEPILQEIFASE